MKENRQHPRLSIAVDVDVSSGSNFYAGRTRDLSLGGLFVETDVPLPIGMLIDVKVKLPKATFTLPCEVVWLLSDREKKTVGVGIRFVELTHAAKRAIEAFMAVRDPVDFEAAEIEDAPASGPPPLPATAPASATKQAAITSKVEPPRPKPPRPPKG